MLRVFHWRLMETQVSYATWGAQILQVHVNVMIPHQSEAIVLRTWPFQESDLLVSVFTRDLGKVRGVARAALKSRNDLAERWNR